jgi:hypothetical protein
VASVVKIRLRGPVAGAVAEEDGGETLALALADNGAKAMAPGWQEPVVRAGAISD